jgi:hypothetical protein
LKFYAAKPKHGPRRWLAFDQARPPGQRDQIFRLMENIKTNFPSLEKYSPRSTDKNARQISINPR